MTTDTPSAQAFGEAIASIVKTAIDDSALRFNQIAIQSGIPRTTLKRKCVTGDFTVKELVALARTLGKDLDYFLQVQP